MKTTNDIVQQLESTKHEIEQFIHELSLEDTAAEERLEKIKDELRVEVKEMKDSLDQGDITTDEVVKNLLSKLSSLESRLQESNGEAVNEIQIFLKKIKNTLKEVQSSLSNENSLNEILEKIHSQLQRYKYKFEIILLKIAIGKLKAKYAGKEAQLQITQKINTLSNFIRNSEQDATTKLRKFRNAVNKIYTDVSKMYS